MLDEITPDLTRKFLSVANLPNVTINISADNKHVDMTVDVIVKVGDATEFKTKTTFHAGSLGYVMKEFLSWYVRDVKKFSVFNELTKSGKTISESPDMLEELADEARKQGLTIVK